MPAVRVAIQLSELSDIKIRSLRNSKFVWEIAETLSPSEHPPRSCSVYFAVFHRDFTVDDDPVDSRGRLQWIFKSINRSKKTS